MPATRTLNDNATDLTVTGSWSDATLPVDGDTVIIPRGNQRISALLGPGLTFGRVEIAFSGTIKSTTNQAWRFDVDNASDDAQMLITGSGQRLTLGGGTDTGIWNDCRIAAIDSRYEISNVRVQSLSVEASTVVLDTDALVDALDVYGGSVTLEANSNAVTADLEGGTTHTKRGGTFNVYAGATLIVDVTDGSSVTINCHGGTVQHVNGDFGGKLKSGRYIDRLEAPATMDAVEVGAGISFSGKTTRASFTNTVVISVGSPQPGAVA